MIILTFKPKIIPEQYRSRLEAGEIYDFEYALFDDGYIFYRYKSIKNNKRFIFPWWSITDMEYLTLSQLTEIVNKFGKLLPFV